jgi:hypothetical protein
MTTGQLIKALQAEDPSGQLPISVDGGDVYFVERQGAYYDGNLQQLVIDETKKPYYSVVGARVTGRGDKVRLHVMGVEDVLLNDPEVPVDIDGLSPAAKARWEPLIEGWRQQGREAHSPPTPGADGLAAQTKGRE